MILNETRKNEYMKQMTEFIEISIGSVYCYNCKGNEIGYDDDRCDDCHRKYMNWSISENVKNGIAEKALEIISHLKDDSNEQS